MVKFIACAFRGSKQISAESLTYSLSVPDVVVVAGPEQGTNQMSNAKFPIGWLTPALCGALLSACSGGGSGERINAEPQVPSDATIEGKWSAVMDWPLIPIHVVLLPDGRVFNFGTDDGSPAGQAVPTGKFFYDVWNPIDGEHLTLPNFTDVDTFCAAQLVLPQPNAGVLLVGGDTFPRPLNPEPTDPTVPEPYDDGNESSTVLDYTLDEPELSQGNDMAAGRWYATVTTLLNGETYVQGGNSVTRTSGELFPEVRSTAGIFRTLAIDTSGLRYYYPRAFVAPNGQLFGYDTDGRMYYVNPAAQTLTRVGDLPLANTGDDSTVAMYAPGRLLQFAGESRGAITIDFRSGGAPVVTPTEELSSHRRLANATLLANGDVLATGGSPIHNTLPGVSYFAEMWNPVTGEWTLGSQGAIPRLYHSTALLLPDATVLVAGGGAPGPAENLNAEIYSPPYLFNRLGGLAVRPVINSSPSTLVAARQFQLGYTDLGGPAARVVLIKTGSQTHGLNMEQRFVELSYATTSCGAPSCLAVRMPSNAADVPPGYYLMFVLNAQGVPSRGKFVFVNVAVAGDASQDPTIVTPADQAGTVGTLVSLAVAGSDPNAGTTLRFAAAGLPTGLRINTNNGVIGGTPTAAGTYDVVVSVSDSTAVAGKPEEKGRTATANFVWTVAP